MVGWFQDLLGILTYYKCTNPHPSWANNLVLLQGTPARGRVYSLETCFRQVSFQLQMSSKTPHFFATSHLTMAVLLLTKWLYKWIIVNLENLQSQLGFWSAERFRKLTRQLGQDPGRPLDVSSGHRSHRKQGCWKYLTALTVTKRWPAPVCGQNVTPNNHDFGSDTEIYAARLYFVKKQHVDKIGW